MLSVRVRNKAYSPVFADKSKMIVMYGGAGSGKSYIAAQKILMRLVEQPGHSILVLRKHKEHLAISVFDQMWSVIVNEGYQDMFTKFNSGPRRIVYQAKGQPESRAVFLGLNDPEDLKSIARVTSIWVEEATQITEEDFNQVQLRMRGFTLDYFQTILTFNPGPTTHWIYKQWFSKAPEFEHVYAESRASTSIYKGTYVDNPFVGPDYTQTMENMRLSKPLMYAAYARGDWSEHNSLVFLPHARHDHQPTGGEVYYGLDFGINDPQALVEVRLVDGLYYVKLLIYEPGLINVTFTKKMLQLGVGKKDCIYADSSRKDLIIDLHRLGWNVHPAKKDRMAGIQTLLNFHERTSIHKDSVGLLSEMAQYGWKTDKNGTNMDDACDGNDHAIDALRYAFHTHNTKDKKRRIWLH